MVTYYRKKVIVFIVSSLIGLEMVACTAIKNINAQTVSMKEAMTYPKNWIWKSPYPVKETMDRLLIIIDSHSEVIQYDRIDQQAVARLSGKDIKAVECVFFQNRKLVGKILNANIEAAYQLPIKATVWEDKGGQVWIQTTNIDAMNDYYQLNGADGAIDAIRKLLPQWINKAIS